LVLKLDGCILSPTASQKWKENPQHGILLAFPWSSWHLLLVPCPQGVDICRHAKFLCFKFLRLVKKFPYILHDCCIVERNNSFDSNFPNFIHPYYTSASLNQICRAWNYVTKTSLLYLCSVNYILLCGACTNQRVFYTCQLNCKSLQVLNQNLISLKYVSKR